MPTLHTNRQRYILKVVRYFSAVGLFTILLIPGCSTTKTGVVSPTPSMTPLKAKHRLESDQRTLRAVAAQLDSTRSEFIALHQRGGWQKRGYFVAVEHNQTDPI